MTPSHNPGEAEPRAAASSAGEPHEVEPLQVEVITIGDELLLGHTIDTNAAFISRELSARGFRIQRRSTVGDDEAAIADAVSAALRRARVVICTGGLGPTQDDFTKPVVARLFGAPLEIDQSIIDELLRRYARRGLKMSDRNISQAEVPRGATVLPNARGTAPGLVLTTADGRHCILLPGVPHELRGLITEQVIPFLEANLRGREPIAFRVLRTTGIPESTVAERLDALLAQIAPLTLAFLPNFAGTDLRITSWGALAGDALEPAIAAAELRMRDILGDFIYGTGTDDLAEVVGALLRERKLTISTAESCTGGLVCKRLTDVPGSSAYVIGGVIAYDNKVKTAELDVGADLLDQYGAVSEPVVRAMAEGALRRFGTDTAIAVTGIAGPAGGSEDKPVGLVWHAAALKGRVEARKFVFPGDREEIRERAAQAGLALLWRMLLDSKAESSGTR